MQPKTREKPNNLDTLPIVYNRQPLTVPLVASLLAKNYKQAHIARLFGVKRQSVNQFIKYHEYDLLALKNPEELLSLTLKDKTLRIVNSIDDADIKKASLQQKMTSGAIGIEKFRLLDGLSTDNVSVRGIVDHHAKELESLKKQREELAASIEDS